MIRLAVRCPAPLAERVLAELLELVPGGVEEDHGDGWVEYAVYGPPGELPALPDLEAAAGEGLIEVSSTEIPDDWADRWRDFHRPISIAGGRLIVRPSWETQPGTPGREAQRATDPGTPGTEAHTATDPGTSGSEAHPATDPGTPGSEAEDVPGICVLVDPGQAFGTGAHATTRMCLELLLELADAGEAGGALVDLGTGSGVLAIAAARLGWAPVLGCDSERAALDAAAQNAVRNGVDLRLERINLRERPAPAAPTVVANLTAPLLAAVAARLAEPPRVLVCSGLLAGEAGSVRAALSGAGLRAAAERSSGDWTALLCRRRVSGADRG
ncbi:MAG: methyltransferase [Solirubrobacterales bacterium]|nr:methyltransferase [Solirubrobacterales bacterium]